MGNSILRKKRHKSFSDTFMDCYFKYEQGICEIKFTCPHMWIYFGHKIYFKLVSNWYCGTCDYHFSLADNRIDLWWFFFHDDVIKWKHFPRYWPFVRGIHRSGPGDFPSQRPLTRSFDVSFDLRLNKRLSKQSYGWRFEMPSRPLWRQCNV